MRGVGLTLAMGACGVCVFFPAAAGDWPQLQHDPQKTGRTDDELAPPFLIAWTFDTTVDGFGLKDDTVQPIISGGKLYFGTMRGYMLCLDAATGALLWDRQVSGPICQTAAVCGGLIIFGSLDGSVYGLSAETGEEKWRFTPEPAMLSGFSTAPCAAEGNVYLGNRAGYFFALAAADGGLLWTAAAGAPVLNSAAYNDGKVFFGDERLIVHCLDARDGREVWASEKLYGQSFKDYHPVIVNGRVIINSMGLARPEFFSGLFYERGNSEKLAGPERKEARFIPRKDFAPAFEDAFSGVAQYMAEQPYLQTVFILDEKTGKQTCVAEQFRTICMAGPVPAPAVTRNGLAAVPIFYEMRASAWPGYAFGLMDPLSGRIAKVIVPERHFNGDETDAYSIAGDILLVLHANNNNACGYSGAFDLAAEKHIPIPLEAMVCRESPVFFSNPNVYAHFRGMCVYTAEGWISGGGEPVQESGNHGAAVSDHRFYHFRGWHHLVCWADSTVAAGPAPAQEKK